MGPMGNVDTGGNGVQGIWATWAMGPMGNVDTGQWGTGGMGHMANEAHRGKVVQGYGVHRP